MKTQIFSYKQYTLSLSHTHTDTVLSINEYTPTESTFSMGHYTTKYSHKYGALIAKKDLLNCTHTHIFHNKFIQNHVAKMNTPQIKVSRAKLDFRP